LAAVCEGEKANPGKRKEEEGFDSKEATTFYSTRKGVSAHENGKGS